MTWIEAPREVTAATAEAMERELAAKGYVPEYARVFAHRPEVYAAWQTLNKAVRSAAGERRYELATLAAALRLRSSYCSLAHGGVLASEHLDAGAVRAIAVGRPQEVLSREEVALVRLADRVASGAAAMTEEHLAEVRSVGLRDDVILDVVLAAAARCFFSTVLDAVGAQPDAAYRALDPVLRDALTVGRPIAEEPGA